MKKDKIIIFTLDTYRLKQIKKNEDILRYILNCYHE